MFEDENEFPVLVNPPGLDRLNSLPGYIDITRAWSNFLKTRPEAEKFTYVLNPRPWTPLRAQPFQLIRDEDVEELHARWSKQVDVLIEIGPPLQQ